ncbi:peptidase S8/S53 domain-containing protein, partial [Phellopilus nigrolimitatus]
IRFSLNSTLASRPAKRSYETHDYYVLEHDPALGVSVQDCADALSAELVEPAGELQNHWLLRAQKADTRTPFSGDSVLDAHRKLLRGAVLGKRDTLARAVKHIARQVPRQRVKRAVIPAPPPVSPEDSGSTSLARGIAERLGIADPLFPDQWHLVNEDYPEHMLNATPVWDMGITGEGVISCLVDDGLDFESDDLAGNFDASGSHDFNDHVDLPKPMLSDDHHGTRCAGQIAAVKNGVCGVGIAYSSKVAGVRILSGPISDVDEAAALNFAYQNTSIYSCSWGPPDDGMSMEAPSLLIQKSMLNGVQNGRDGKGSVFVFASGNGANSGDQCNFDGYTNSIYSVTVASIDYKGEHPYYSEACAANMVTAYSSGSNHNKAIVTTDVGKDKCTKNHGGTSAAAPNAVGIFALALSVRPDLSWRDIQHLCVQTAQIVNPADKDWELTATGRPYSYKYGFGKLDAYDFVTAAQQWQNVKPQAWLEMSPVQLADGTLDANGKFAGGAFLGADGLESTMEVTGAMLAENNFESLEHVTVRVWIEHTRRGHVEVALTSPSGVRSVLAEKRERDRDENGFPGWRFMSVKHWGENPIGKWTLKVSDENAENESGRFIGWSLSLWGSAKDAGKAVPYVLKQTDELPVVFPPPKPTPVPESTTTIASTTKSYQKPTVTKPAEADVESTAAQPTSTPAGGIDNMDENTRFWIAGAGSALFVLLLGGGAALIVRRVERNRAHRQGAYAPVARADGEEVRMRLLEPELGAARPVSARHADVVFDAGEEEGLARREEVASGAVGFHSGFLEDDELAETAEMGGMPLYSDEPSAETARREGEVATESRRP